MIYVFIFEPGYFKIGTCNNVYDRMLRGFWMNVHLPLLCGRLDNCWIYKLFRGDLDDEKAIHATLEPDVGEFYELHRLCLVVAVFHFLLEPLCVGPMPMRLPTRRQRRVCCGGHYGGFSCHYAYARSFATVGRKKACPYCMTRISVRRDRQLAHQKRCLAMRERVASDVTVAYRVWRRGPLRPIRVCQ